MNTKAQMDIHPASFAGALLGGLFAVFLADRMYAGTGMKILIFIVVGIVCFFVTNFIFNKD